MPLYAPHTVTRMFIWMRRVDREPSGGLLAESKGGVAYSCLCQSDTRGREVSRQPNGIPRLSRVFRIACSRMQPFAGPADPQPQPCPVLITTQPTQPLYTFKFFCSRKNSRCICKRFKRVLEQPLYWHMRRTGKNRYNM